MAGRLQIFALIIVAMLSSATIAAAHTNFQAPQQSANGQSLVEDYKTPTVLAQRGGWGRAYRPNFNYQRQLQQQRLQQQRLQQQRLQQQRQRQQMEQHRRQQAIMRQRMQEQRRIQQQAMRARQQQMMAQRQRLQEHRRLTQNRQRAQQQQLQTQQRQATQRQIQNTQRAAQARMADQRRMQKLRQLRDRNLKLERQRATSRRSNDAAATAALIRGPKAVSAVRSAQFDKGLKTTKTNLAKVRQIRPVRTQRVKQVAANQKPKPTVKSRNCSGGVCKLGNCSFHGGTLVKTYRGMVPIRAIQAGSDFVWAKNEETGEEDWRRVTDHFSNIYDEIVQIDIRSADGLSSQTILSNRIHPFYAKSRAPPVVSASFEHPSTGADLLPHGEWLRADELRPGDHLLQANGGWSIVGAVSTSIRRFVAFNLSVDDFRTYFVGGKTTEHSVWVHNECPNQKLTKISDRISNKQLRHLKDNAAYRGGGYLNSKDDAQKILSDYKNGNVKVLGRTKNGHIVVEHKEITGYNDNPGAGFRNQPTNVFLIKGTTKVSIVPTNPNWQKE